MLRSAEEVAKMHIGHGLQLHVASTTKLLQTTMDEAKSSEEKRHVLTTSVRQTSCRSSVCQVSKLLHFQAKSVRGRERREPVDGT